MKTLKEGAQWKMHKQPTLMAQRCAAAVAGFAMLILGVGEVHSQPANPEACAGNEQPASQCPAFIEVDLDATCDWALSPPEVATHFDDPDNDVLSCSASPASGHGSGTRAGQLACADVCHATPSVCSTTVVPRDRMPVQITVGQPLGATFELTDEWVSHWSHVDDICALSFADNCTKSYAVRHGIIDVRSSNPDEVIFGQPGAFRSPRGLVADWYGFRLNLDRNLGASPRTYTFTYAAVDEAGNLAEVPCVVEVVEPVIDDPCAANQPPVHDCPDEIEVPVDSGCYWSIEDVQQAALYTDPEQDPLVCTPNRMWGRNLTVHESRIACHDNCHPASAPCRTRIVPRDDIAVSITSERPEGNAFGLADHWVDNWTHVNTVCPMIFTDNCTDSEDIARGIVEIRSSDPDETMWGEPGALNSSGGLRADWHRFSLNLDRNLGATEKIYTIVYAAVDESGNLSRAECVVRVVDPTCEDVEICCDGYDNDCNGVVDDGCDILYVDADAPGNRNGTSWENAYQYLQKALHCAGVDTEIRVAQGTYRPDQDRHAPLGDRNATFFVRHGVTVRGGFAGFGEPDPDAQDFELYETILSGNLDGAHSNNVMVCQRLMYDEEDRHLIVIEGFTISGGRAVGECFSINNSENRGGGGGLNCQGWATIRNCRFIDNTATCGGGLYLGWPRTPYLSQVVIDSVFLNNTAEDGGGMEVYPDTSAVVHNVKFLGNHAGNRGGGFHFWGDGFAHLVNCLFSGNTTGRTGGAIETSGSLTVSNTTIVGNHAASKGGGIYCWSTGCPVVHNSVLWNNTDETADTPGAQFHNESYVGGDYDDRYLWFSAIEGWTGKGTGFVTEAPRFVDADGPDDTYGTLDDDARVQPDSPCVDTGSHRFVRSLVDLDGHPRIVGAQVDIGAGELGGDTRPPPIYVDGQAIGDNSGTSWENALTNLQDALELSNAGDEIWIAGGIYRPDQGGDYLPGDRTATFRIKKGVILRGGMMGWQAHVPNGRQGSFWLFDRPEETILSGDLAEDDGAGFANRDDNSLHVITCEASAPQESPTTLDQVTIRGGFANGPAPDDVGGGMLCRTSASLTNVTFEQNWAQTAGGGLFVSPTGAQPTPMLVRHASFNANHARDGGAIAALESNLTVLDTKLMGNTADQRGAGIFLGAGSTSTLTNSVFSGNHSLEEGGAIHQAESSDIEVLNCTFHMNQADHHGGGIFRDALSQETRVINSILWNNLDSTGATESSQIHRQGGSIFVHYSLVLGWSGGGEGNLDTDPNLRNPDGEDNIVGTVDDRLDLRYESVCHNTGDPTFVTELLLDIDANARVNHNGQVNIGAYSR